MCLFIFILVTFLVLFGGLVGGFVLPKSELYRLDIVHYNDFHARFEETSIPYPVCQSNDSNCLGGFPRLYHEIQVLMKEKPGSLLLNAGDVYQGSYWYTLMKWNITQKFVNLLPNDAHAIGNHEFDDGVPGLAPYLAAMKAPVLAANIDTSEEPSLDGLIKPTTVIERNGRKIGIIGLITPDTATGSNPGKVKFLDPIEATRREAQKLHDGGIDIIILLSHCGLNVDKIIAEQVGENIDVIVGGHSHSLLWNGTSPSNETISGPYPVLVDKNGHNVLIVTASAFTKYLGNLTVFFDDLGELQAYDGEPVYLNRSIPEDPKISALLQPYADELHAIMNEELGVSETDLLMEKCGGEECEIANMITDSFAYATKRKNILNHAPVVFIIRNMIRGSIPKGVITRGAVINALPFTNRVVALTLPGRQILEALELGLTNYWTKKPFEGPFLPHVAGLQVVLNSTSAKAISVKVKEGDSFVPLDLEQRYLVTTMDFLARGGSGFTMFKEYGANMTYVGKDSGVLEDYVKHFSPLNLTLDNRLTVVE